MQNKVKHFYLLILSALALTSCSHHKKADVSDIHLEVHIARFDHDFDQMRTQPMSQQAAQMQQKYGSFYSDYMEQVLEAGNTRDTAYFATLRKVLSSKPYQDLKHETDSVYPNLDKQEAELTDAFKRIKYYFPQQRLPKMYAYVSGFQAQTSIGNDYFAIGLDLFLGANSKFYPALINAYPHYIARRFTPEYITPRVIESLGRENMFPQSVQNKSLLSKMIYEGKILYFMDQVLPDTPDSLKIGYTTQQADWCKNFESSIWGYFLEQNLLYETDFEKIQKYFSEAPFTPGLGEKNESAPRLAVWTGWQIVRAYMDKHTDVTLPQLMANQDAQQILNDSHYHPK
ncbi:gliding motility lipoprotein GldB [Mucilaginibacter robiniae]|uniref:Gliding motility lipoprotein GldB n=1 Tax=Mucilaginibacter robiniae TaxID=2728022 RepID=A0A7L5E5B9_9SPHI|nr:gliding motility lipoprotein GldB [Mucilaginibacter robiniae]QJD95536.1 gliding motility lipoprotein GldB [Mucilaginibacter robiniae]